MGALRFSAGSRRPRACRCRPACRRPPVATGAAGAAGGLGRATLAGAAASAAGAAAGAASAASAGAAGAAASARAASALPPVPSRPCREPPVPPPVPPALPPVRAAGAAAGGATGVPPRPPVLPPVPLPPRPPVPRAARAAAAAAAGAVRRLRASRRTGSPTCRERQSQHRGPYTSGRGSGPRSGTACSMGAFFTSGREKCLHLRRNNHVTAQEKSFSDTGTIETIVPSPRTIPAPQPARETTPPNPPGGSEG